MKAYLKLHRLLRYLTSRCRLALSARMEAFVLSFMSVVYVLGYDVLFFENIVRGIAVVALSWLVRITIKVHT
jgi:hypothetical protein